MEIINFRPVFWVFLGAAGITLLWLAGRRHLRWWPAWFTRLMLVFIILSGIQYSGERSNPQTLGGREILLVDQSFGLPTDELARLRRLAETWQQAGQNRLVISFANRSAPVLNFRAWPDVDGQGADPASALNYAGDLLGKEKGRIILVSSGKAKNETAVEAAIRQLSENGQIVDILPEATQPNPLDGTIGAIQAPTYLWEGTPFNIDFPVYSPGGLIPELKLSIDGQVMGLRPVLLQNGRYRFTIPAQKQGIVTLRVDAIMKGDPNPTNNSVFAAIQVFSTPRVLFVSADPGKDAKFLDMLKQSGLRIDTVSPNKLPKDVGNLSAYKVVILDDILAIDLTTDQMMTLRTLVTENSGGLIFLGGRNSYTLGGYKDSLLEPLLPVKLEPPPRPQRPPITFLIVLDRSSSMNVDFTGNRPITLSLEAAIRATENLTSQDYFGLLAFSDSSSWEIPIQKIGTGLSLRQILDKISRITADGGTMMFEALQNASQAIADLPITAPASRHILLLSDGLPTDHGDFPLLARNLNQKYHTTISTIALGADSLTMSGIAEAGKGRYYEVDSARDLPRIMLDESRAGRSENIQAGTTSLRLNVPNHPVLSGMSEADLPILTSYNALSSKKDFGAEDILVSNSFQDPILSAWQYGSGRVIAWMSGTSPEWTEDWKNPKNEDHFWTQVIRYALPNPSLGPFQAEVKVNETQISVVSHLQTLDGQLVNLAKIIFSYVDLSGKTHSLALSQTEPGTYELVLPRLPEGAYRSVISYEYSPGPGSNTTKGDNILPFALNYLPEAQPGEMSADQHILENWAKNGGAKTIQVQDLVEDVPKTPANSAAAVENWLLIVLVSLVIFWPVEIAIRRRWLPWN